MLGFCTSTQLDKAYRTLSVDKNTDDDTVLTLCRYAVSNAIMIYEESKIHIVFLG
jgi:hypothetical protein